MDKKEIAHLSKGDLIHKAGDSSIYTVVDNNERYISAVEYINITNPSDWTGERGEINIISDFLPRQTIKNKKTNNSYLVILVSITYNFALAVQVQLVKTSAAANWKIVDQAKY